jgi:hypothetical protein
MSSNLVDQLMTVLGENAPVSREQVECVLNALGQIHPSLPEPALPSADPNTLPL